MLGAQWNLQFFEQPQDMLGDDKSANRNHRFGRPEGQRTPLRAALLLECQS